MNKKLIREMRFMMERLESPRMTDSEVQKKYKKLSLKYPITLSQPLTKKKTNYC